MTQQTYTPDWSKAPPQANWWARDKDGSGFWYSKRPSAHRHSFIADCCFVAADNDCPFIDCSFELDNWRDTLTVRPFQDRDIPQNLSDYFTGKTPFIIAYVDLLLARMAKEDRYSDDDCVGEFPAPDAPDVCIYSRDGESENFAIILGKETSGYSTRLFTWVLGSGDNSFGFFHLDDTDFSSESESWLRTITELEAIEFRAAMEAVYG